MWRALFTTAILLAIAVVNAEDSSSLARVIDSHTDRVPTHTVAPQYPRKARRDRIEGEVEVCFDVDRKGRPRRIAVRNSTNRAFERPSIDAVRVSFFRPLEDDEELQSIKSCRTFIFSLQPVDDGVE